MAASGLTILLLLKKKRIELERQHLIEHFNHLNDIPPELINPMFSRNLFEVEKYCTDTTEYAKAYETQSSSYIADLLPGHKHHDIHVVSIVESFEVLTGFSLDQFSKLLFNLGPILQETFPHSRYILKPGEQSNYSSIRMKLFMFLFRFKNGCSFYLLEALFGWSKSILQEQFEVILCVVYHKMKCFHKDIFVYLTPAFQQSELLHWNHLHHTVYGNFDAYIKKIREENADAVKNRDTPVIDENLFVGSLGAVDGTYSIRPSFTPATLNANNEDPLADRMYSEYVKLHAYKLVLLCSHGLTNKYKKLILNVQIGCGSASDTSLYSVMHDEIQPFLLSGAAFLGDNAFHRAKRVIPPYNSTQTTLSGNPAHCIKFNREHSHERMTSEHGVKFMKYWGCIRGRNDTRLFEKNGTFDQAVYVAQAFHNFKALNCPEFM